MSKTKEKPVQSEERQTANDGPLADDEAGQGATDPKSGDDGEAEQVDADARTEDAPSADEVEAAAEAVEAARGPGPGDALSDEELLQRACALVFASPEPLGLARLVTLLERPKKARLLAALDALATRLEESSLPLRLRGLAGGYTLMTAPELAETVASLSKTAATERISPAALETLAVVAYRQPVTKAEIEAIRGVQAGPILRSLVDRGLVRVTGRADVPGHPLQYGTTKDFLDRFGLMSTGDLPRDSELTRD